METGFETIFIRISAKKDSIYGCEITIIIIITEVLKSIINRI